MNIKKQAEVACLAWTRTVSSPCCELDMVVLRMIRDHDVKYPQMSAPGQSVLHLVSLAKGASMTVRLVVL